MFTIAAVGITSTSLIAVLGSAGLMVNLFIFVILGLPSKGATIALEAAPRVFGWLAKFEPMHQVFLVRGRCCTSTAAPTRAWRTPSR